MEIYEFPFVTGKITIDYKQCQDCESYACVKACSLFGRAILRIEAGKPALFIVVPEFLDHLRSTFSPDSKVSYDDVFESVKTAPLLVLDDFGEQSATPWAREKLYQMLNYRYNSRLPSVVTTRLSFDEILGEVDPAISSRLVDGQTSVPFNITAPDYRGDRKAGRKRSSPRGKTGRYR